MVATNTHPYPAPEIVNTKTGPASRAALSRKEAEHDKKLVQRFNSGDESAFAEIISRYQSKMYSIALSHLRNHSDAEEIAQDTFIRAHRGLARFRGDSSLATWLHRIAFNLSRNRFKYYFCRRRHAMLSLDCAFSDDNSSTFSELIASEAPSPAREATACEFTELVTSCMEKLGASQREILNLRNAMGQSYGDISRSLGISVGTVKSRIGRAREKLRELLAVEYPEAAQGGSPLDWFEPMRPTSRVGIACA
ncbi:MAG TPA: sigma-70 family RNA polymerase sigma factor [Opitutaceae bacterium]